MPRNGTCTPARLGTMESRHSFKEWISWQTKEIADAIPKRIAARTRDPMQPDAARKTIRGAASADLRAALRVPRARRADATAAKAPSRSGVPDAIKRKVLRAAPEAARRGAALPRGAVLLEAKTTSSQRPFPFLTGLPRRPVLFWKDSGATEFRAPCERSVAIQRYGRDGAASARPPAGSSTERDLWMSVSFPARSMRRK
jgi:hypothetical protein